MTGDYYTFDGDLVTAEGDAFLVAASTADAAFATWRAKQADAVTAFGAEAGAEYGAKVVDPLRQRQSTVVSGLRDWAAALARWKQDTGGADADVAASFSGAGGAGTGSTTPIETA